MDKRLSKIGISAEDTKAQRAYNVKEQLKANGFKWYDLKKFWIKETTSKEEAIEAIRYVVSLDLDPMMYIHDVNKKTGELFNDWSYMETLEQINGVEFEGREIETELYQETKKARKERK